MNVKTKILIIDDEINIINALKRLFIKFDYDVLSTTKPEEVKARHPLTIRVVLSGYADSSLIVKIQRESLAKRYLYKPWKNQDFIRTVEQMFRIEKILTGKNLLGLINKIDYLPSPGNVYQKFNSLVAQDANIDRIAKTIKTDQSIAAKAYSWNYIYARSMYIKH